MLELVRCRRCPAGAAGQSRPQSELSARRAPANDEPVGNAAGQARSGPLSRRSDDLHSPDCAARDRASGLHDQDGPAGQGRAEAPVWSSAAIRRVAHRRLCGRCGHCRFDRADGCRDDDRQISASDIGFVFSFFALGLALGAICARWAVSLLRPNGPKPLRSVLWAFAAILLIQGAILVISSLIVPQSAAWPVLGMLLATYGFPGGAVVILTAKILEGCSHDADSSTHLVAADCLGAAGGCLAGSFLVSVVGPGTALSIAAVVVFAAVLLATGAQYELMRPGRRIVPHRILTPVAYGLFGVAACVVAGSHVLAHVERSHATAQATVAIQDWIQGRKISTKTTTPAAGGKAATYYEVREESQLKGYIFRSDDFSTTVYGYGGPMSVILFADPAGAVDRLSNHAVLRDAPVYQPHPGLDGVAQGPQSVRTVSHAGSQRRQRRDDELRRDSATAPQLGPAVRCVRPGRRAGGRRDTADVDRGSGLAGRLLGGGHRAGAGRDPPRQAVEPRGDAGLHRSRGRPLAESAVLDRSRDSAAERAGTPGQPDCECLPAAGDASGHSAPGEHLLRISVPVRSRPGIARLSFSRSGSRPRPSLLDDDGGSLHQVRRAILARRLSFS